MGNEEGIIARLTDLAVNIGSMNSHIEHIRENQSAIREALDAHIKDETASLDKAVIAVDELKADIQFIKTTWKIMRVLVLLAISIAGAWSWGHDKFLHLMSHVFGVETLPPTGK